MAYTDKDKQRSYQREWARRRYAKQQEVKRELKSGGCILCGEREVCCLDFHHVSGEKLFTIASGKRPGEVYRAGLRHEDMIREEAKKCVVLCRNCHAKVHSGMKSIDVTERASQ